MPKQDPNKAQTCCKTGDKSQMRPDYQAVGMDPIRAMNL